MGAFALAAALLFAGRPVLAAEPLLDRLLIIAPAAPGGGWDQTARAMQHALEREGLVRVVEVQNVAGAAGTIGLAQFVDSYRGNGRALLVSGLVMLGATLWNDSPVSMEQVTPIARLTGEYEVVAVAVGSPHRDMRSVADALRARPGSVSWGGGSAGGTDHILAGLIGAAAGIDPQRVNYIAFSGGGEAVAALLGGNVTAGVSGYSEFAAHIESGRLRALAISAGERILGIDVPTLREQGLDVELANWRAVLAPPAISREDRNVLSEVIGRLVKSATWRQTLIDRGWTDIHQDGEAFARYLASERARVGHIVTRLRGPAAQAGDAPAVSRLIFPAAVFGGAALVTLSLAVRGVGRARAQRAQPVHHPPNARAIMLVGVGLAAFVILLEPLGFVVAATVLFLAVRRAFLPPQAGGSPRTGTSWRHALAGPAIAAVFSALVYIAFTRGLDLALPAGAIWSWMR